MAYKIAIIVGSLRQGSINRKVARSICGLKGDNLDCSMIEIGDLPLYNQDYDGLPEQPEQYTRFRDQVRAADGVLFVSPEYNRSIPGALKNAIDWASRPWGQNSFDHMPAAVIGASIGQIGTAVAQQSLRGVLSFCNARQMTAPEAYIYFHPEAYGENGEVTDEGLAEVLRTFMQEFRTHVERVLTVLPRS